MDVFTDSEQLLLIANIAYPLSLVLIGGVCGHYRARNIFYQAGYEDGEAMGRHTIPESIQKGSNNVN